MALALLVGLPLVPGAAAADTIGELEAAGLHAQGATNTTSGFQALIQPYMAQPNEAWPAGFEATGDKVRVETDRAETLRVQGVVSRPHDPQTSTDTYHGAAIKGQRVDIGSRMDVLPLSPGLATVVLDTLCAELRDAEEQQISRSPKVQTPEAREGLEAHTSDSLRWRGCSQTTTLATITGDFVFSAWEVDFELTEGDNTYAYWSGHGDSQNSPHPVSDEYVKEDRELYVYVTNGTMHVPLAADANYALFLDADAAVEVEGNLYLEAASGEIQVGQDMISVEGEDVALHGDLELQGKQGSWLLGGDVHDARLDGQAMDLSVPATPEKTSPWLWLLPLAGLVVLVAYPARHYRRLEKTRPDEIYALPDASWRQREASGLAAMASQQLDYGHPWRGLILVRLALLFSRHHQIRIVQATAYHDVDRVQAALQVHERLDAQFDGSPRDRCRNAWHALRIASRNRCDEDADAWMRRAKRYDLHHFLELSQALPTYDAGNGGLRTPAPRGDDVAYS